MNGFKLIGIRPHKECDKKFLKLLEPGRLYQFYNDYKFFIDEKTQFDGLNGEIHSYEIDQTIPEDLYKIGNLNINVSAIVGKNGTGKSTLIELLLYCVYYLGTNLENEKGEKILYPYHDHISYLLNAHEQKLKDYGEKKKAVNRYVENCLLNKQKNQISKRKINKNFTKLQEELLSTGFSMHDFAYRKTKLESNRTSADNEHQLIVKSLKCSLFFEINTSIYELKIDNSINFKTIDSNSKKISILGQRRTINIISILTPKSIEILNSFFYSIVLNYSHHSLNSKHLGFWINTLFHKNDGYKTPAVINPMRENGKFDINDENKLAKSRLLVNLLVDCLVNKNKTPLITDKQIIYKVRFTFNNNKYLGKDIKTGNPSSSDSNDHFIISGTKNLNLLRYLYDYTFEEDNLSIYNNSLPFNTEVHNYISDKSEKIEEQYPEYKVKWSNDDNIFTATRRYAKYLVDDKSHITYKLKQALYFLEKTAKDDNNELWNQNKKHFDFELDELLRWMEIESVDELENIFTRIPPAIFDIDFLLIEKSQKKTTLSFLEDLSSGEQQKIHTLNTIIYHLNNLYSVHLSKSEDERITYDNVNIVLDEIELYYHPDLQRRFISDLVETIEGHNHLKNGKFITGLNFIFSTHSPFILSDIPASNVLRLTVDSDGKSKPQSIIDQTFGANIHDLLANDFFLKDGFIGEFAREKIEGVIKGLTILINQKEIEKINKAYKSESIPDYIQMKREHLEEELNFLREENKAIVSENEILAISSIIGEPILKEKVKLLIKLALNHDLPKTSIN